MMKPSIKFGLIMLVVGIAIGTAITWTLGPFGDTRVHVMEGSTTYANYDGTAIGFSERPGEQGKGYDLAGAMWQEHRGPWNERLGWGESSTCIRPLTSGQKVRLGVVNIAPTQEAPGREVVVWMECLD
ncbi:Uncharacterised protein [uncultured archaeon]|nr:Uncharacterised protein [uncultured archaeon]